MSKLEEKLNEVIEIVERYKKYIGTPAEDEMVELSYDLVAELEKTEYRTDKKIRVSKEMATKFREKIFNLKNDDEENNIEQ